jgi:hypothetical protein
MFCFLLDLLFDMKMEPTCSSETPIESNGLHDILSQKIEIFLILFSFILVILFIILFCVPTLADRGCCVVSAMNPHGR